MDINDFMGMSIYTKKLNEMHKKIPVTVQQEEITLKAKICFFCISVAQKILTESHIKAPVPVGVDLCVEAHVRTDTQVRPYRFWHFVLLWQN